MKEVIYCRPTDCGVHSFYVISGGVEYFLFTQDYRKGVQTYYSRGVSFNDACNFSKAHKDSAIIRTMTKIPTYIKYIEKQYGVEILEKTKKRNKYNNFSMAKCG